MQRRRFTDEFKSEAVKFANLPVSKHALVFSAWNELRR